jgi:hypothetical protein
MVTTAFVQFRGRIVCRHDVEGPLGLILIGETTDPPGEVAHLAFSARAPAGLPDALENARVDRLDERRYRIASGSNDWIVEGVAHLHREVGEAFALAIPTRAVPWRKRLFWWLALRAAAHRWFQRLLFKDS